MAFQGDSIYWVEVDKIVPNPLQPRREFDEQKLRELAESIKMYGILQPLTVTRKEIAQEDGTFYTEYELIAGERRLRASKIAGLTQIPVIIREGEESEQEKLELAIIENLQREDLNAVDRALAFRQLADMFGLSHSQVARKVGRSREYVSNTIRLLGLPDYMQSAMKRGEISEGHARTLLMLNDRPEEQDVVFREILLKKLSVREVERIVRKIATDKIRKKDWPYLDSDIIDIEKRFMETLGTRVQIQKTDYGGRLTIDYFSLDDLEAMLARMKADGIASPAGAVGESEQVDALARHTPIAVATASVLTAEPEVVKDLTSEVITERRSEEVMTESDEALLIDEHRDEVVPTYVPAKPETTAGELAQRADSVTLPAVMPSSAVAEVMNVNLAETLPAPLSVVGEEMADVTLSPATETTKEPAVVVAPQEEDESDLYSIRHFSV